MSEIGAYGGARSGADDTTWAVDDTHSRLVPRTHFIECRRISDASWWSDPWVSARARNVGGAL